MKTLLIFLLLTTSCLADTRIIDGDTIVINGERIRFYGIDCPEKNQPYGKEAAEFSKTLLPKLVNIYKVGIGRYDRTIALLYTSELCINGELIKAGLAWVYTRYCELEICNEWKEQQQEAQRNRIGLWKDSNPINPATWRKIKKRRLK